MKLQVIRRMLESVARSAARELYRGASREIESAIFDQRSTKGGGRKTAANAIDKDVDGNSRDFYRSSEWRRVRLHVLHDQGYRCVKCGSTYDLTVDHIKPRSLHPNIALDPGNCQVLCRRCNSAKSNRHSTDYRNRERS